VKTDFYNDLKHYLATLAANPFEVHSLEDVISYNKKHASKEGGLPGHHDAWPTGQDNLERCMESKGSQGKAYTDALVFIRTQSREKGIDAALSNNTSLLDGLLVPIQADDGVACQVAAKAGAYFRLSCLPFFMYGKKSNIQY